ncbi:unnamed protein product, partial [Meganyctiphanes norvegica]
GQKYLICCDSLSALQAIKTGSCNYLVHQILEKINNSPKEIHLEWVPSHLNLPGNNLADELAQNALNLDIIENLPLDYSDYKINIKKQIHLKWQRQWDETNEGPNETNLYKIKPVLKNWPSSNRKNRQEEVILTRLRLDTNLLNRKHKFTGDNFPLCQTCQTRLTSNHILIECP